MLGYAFTWLKNSVGRNPVLGAYNIHVVPGAKLPQKVASAFDEIFGKMVGASYGIIAYLGSKIVSGTNHAILATQVMVTGNDVHNVVLIVLNEKNDHFEIVEITNLLSDSGKLGGLNIAPTTDIPEDAMEVFNKNFEGFLGTRLEPFALLGTQIVNGTKYVFACKSKMVISPNATGENAFTDGVTIVSAFSNYRDVEFKDVILGTSDDENGATLKQGALGAPLGEWP